MFVKIKKRAFGFTLAEVLITLGIIGVVAAMTIPTLMNKTNDKQTVVALKKAYTVLSQAYLLAVQDNGTADNWTNVSSNSGSADGAIAMINTMAPYMKVTKNCGNGLGCFPTDTYKYLSGADWGTHEVAGSASARAQLADGSLIQTWSYGNCTYSRGNTPALQSICGEFMIDVNGFKKPNQLGADMFYFYMTKFALIPVGTQQENGVATFTFDGGCKDATTAMGRGCTAWVIYNENMDYKKCPNTLSWSGPTSCN